MNALAHQGDVGFAGFDDCGYRVMSSDEQQKKRKSRGLCQTCGEVRTHRPGLLKSMQMPETIEGLVYKGICLKCNSLDAAKMQLCEPLDGPDNNDRLNNVYGSNRNKNTQSPPGYQKIKMAMPSQDAELNLSEEPERGNSMKDTTKKNAALKSFEAIYQRTASARKSYMTKEKQPVTAENEENDDDDDDDDDGELSNPSDDVVDSVAVQNQRVAHVKEKDQHSNNNNNHSFNSSRMNNSSNNSNMNNISNSSNMNNSSNNNMNNNSFNNISGCSSKNELKKEAMNDFRCADSNGDSGFFTGTVISQHTGTSNASGDHHQHKLPHGRGEMVYDEGRIAKGVWVNGLLKIQVKSDRGERYEPYLLAGFSIGHMGYEEDMVNTSRGETVGAVSKLHVNDCAFIRRSDGSWSYAIVKSRTDGETPSITFQVNFQGSTKTISLAQWGGYVRTPTKPDILPQYSIGDPGNEKDMIIEASKTDTVKAVSKLKVNDAAFVKRSDMSWAYAILVDRSSGGEMKFEVNARGSTKVIALLQCGKFVRRVKKADDGGDDGLTEEEASAIFKSMKTVVAETNE